MQPGYRGDLSIVSNGDAFAEEPCCDFPTQLEHSAGGYLWDGEYDFSYYKEEVDDNFCSPDIDCFGAEEDVDSYDAVVEVACSDAVEVATCSDAEEVACYDAEEVAHRQQQTSTAAGYGGDYGIVSDGDDIDREPFYDLVTQLPQEDPCLQYPDESIDQGFVCDIMEEQEFTTCEASVEDCHYLDAEVEDCDYPDAEDCDSPAVEVEDCNYYYFAEDCYDC